jgi:transposase
LKSQQAEHGGPVLPKSPMGQAIGYALNQWEALCVYTTDGDLEIDNNKSENALRRIALGRKNWIFLGSDNGGRTAAILFSLIATCQRHKVDAFAYLRDVLTRLAPTSVSQLDQFLPDRWQAAQASLTPVN